MSTPALTHNLDSSQSRDLACEAADLCPLSFAQERLWFLDQLNPGSAAYNIVQAWRLQGPFNPEIFEAAVNELLRRHEILRTLFPAANGRPAEVISAHVPVSLNVEDLSLSSNPEAELRRVLNDEVCRPFDLGGEFLFRLRLVRIEHEDHAAVFNMHHIISDGWSFEILRREISECYSALAAGRQPDLPELSIQYLDYARWQREQHNAPATLEESIGFWKEQLADSPPTLALPTDHRRTASSADKGDSVDFALSDELSASLRQLAKTEETTLFVVLLAAFNALLFRITSQDDIVVGSAVSGRTLPETEPVIGLFIDTIPLRTRLDGDMRFRDLLRRVRSTVIGSLCHAELPFEKIVEAVHPERDAQLNPFFQVVLSLRQAYPESWSMGPLRGSLLEVRTQRAKFAWTFLLEECVDGIKGRLEYQTDLFEPDSVRRFLQLFKILLCGVAADPSSRVARLPLNTAAELQNLLSAGDAVGPYERDATIPRLFELQAARTPDAIALLTSGGERVSYRELNARANGLAHRLLRMGLPAQARIGVLLARSPELIVALLGILKAGAAYVPLDREYPEQRLQFMIRDAEVSLLVTDSSFDPAASRLLSGSRGGSIPAIDIDSMSPEADSSNPSIVSAATDPCYVMYTSGSTGTPKGVVIPHRGVVRLVRFPNYVNISPEDVFLQFAPASFDASTFEIWGALLNGARLVIAPTGVPSLEELGRLIEANGVSILWLTAGLFHQMIDHQADRLKSVRQLLAGGDVLSVPHVRSALSALPGCQLINGYGPTENTTFSCCYPIPPDWRADRAVPIGRPVSNTHVLILDSELAPVPVGVPGELCVGGDGLALGYLNQPALTAEKFVPNPHPSRVSGDRLYRTGDRARWLPDGTIEFLGRTDQQVKIRGFRVEPGEIEAALANHPAVRNCIVLPREHAGGKELTAYVAVKAEGEIQEELLQRSLASILPSHMVPSRIVFLDELPLTPHGKVDRRRLPVLQESARSKDFASPSTPTEAALLEIWQAVLGRTAFGIRENFFQLGGHSLLATQVISRIAKGFHVELPVRAIFECPTIAQLAVRIGEQPRTAPGAPPISRRNSRASARALLDRIDQLTESEVESLLATTPGTKSVS